MKNNYSPDILNCLANLSSDEVFTSPELANRMLDLLPPELFRSTKTRFLDPCSKSGVFLREIAKRLLAGLEEQIPDLQQRIDHIMTKQVFGIACTDLTAEMSCRTLYCTKQANGEYSVCTAFGDSQGNLRYMRCQHTWENGKCKHCGANRAQYDRVETIETYAYPFIHKSIQEILKKDMQFDVIIGNPPYQISDGGGMQTESSSGSAIPLYHKFVLQAQKLSPRYLIMIIKANWYSSGRGLDEFRDAMLSDKRIDTLVDFEDSRDCFPGVDIAGGICYFMWNRDKRNIGCRVINVNKQVVNEDYRVLNEYPVFVRSNRAIKILKKIQVFDENTMDKCVYSSKPFGFRSFQTGEEKAFKNSVSLFGSKGISYVRREDVGTNRDLIDKWKVIVSKTSAEHAGQADKEGRRKIISKVEILEPNTICSESYLLITTFESMFLCENLISYIKTRFCRFFMSLAVLTQNMARQSFQFVPLQDFSHPWTDEMLYKKYNLDKDEIAFIESMIRPME
jgi:site-specific DNA-methyltransferase (adenine-specific)